MDLRIERAAPLSDRVLGSLIVDGAWQCFTREPPMREDRVFIPGESGLPLGHYNVSLAKSARHHRTLPLLASTRHDGEERRGVRIGMFIYPGNSHDTTEPDGEIVLGQEQLGRSLSRTRLAFNELFVMLIAAVDRREAIDLLIC